MSPTALHTPADAREPVTALPARPVFLAAFGATGLIMAAWAVVMLLLGRSDWIAAGLSGSLLATLVSVGSLAALRPGRPRPIGTWATLWLAALVARLFVTPAAAFLLYSATPLALSPLMLSVAATYIAVQLVEATVLAAHLKPPPFGTNGVSSAVRNDGDSDS